MSGDLHRLSLAMGFPWLLCKLRSFPGGIQNWLPARRAKRDWRKGRPQQSGRWQFSEARARTCWGGLPRVAARWVHLPTCYQDLKYAEASTGCGPVCHGHRGGLNNTCSLKAVSLKWPLLWEQWVEPTFQGQGRGQEPPIVQATLLGYDCAFDNLCQHPYICSLASENLSARVGMWLSHSSEISGKSSFLQRCRQ